jgi:ABC-type multidrug transport system ATPase subunit
LGHLDPRQERRQYHRRLGFLSAGSGGLYAHLSVLENLDFWAALAFVPRRRRRSAVLGSIERFELEPLADNRVDRLSMGERQRVRLAMTFVHSPEVVLLDEPFTSLDDAGKGLVNRALEELASRSGSALWCSPTPEPGGPRFDASYVMEDGRAVAI